MHTHTRLVIDPANKIILFGSGADGGADEDDFHVLNRKKVEVGKDEKVERVLDGKPCLRSAISKASASKPVKVVFF
jgi:hypothetical protein